jgi:hypothetical protein
VVPRALRTLSVVTVLSAVSGAVFLTTDQHLPGPPTVNLGDDTTLTAAFLPESSPATPAALAPDAPAGSGAALVGADLVDRAAVPGSAAIESAEVVKLRLKALRKLDAQEKAAAWRLAAAERKAAAARTAKAAWARASRNAGRDPKALARIMVADRGWGAGQFSCLNSLWMKESRWNYRATNPSSGAYGIPQALPGSKMAGVASDWRTNPATQITWGLNYIEDRYGTPCGAWGHSQSSNWY